MDPLPNYDAWLTHDRKAEEAELAALSSPAGDALPDDETSPPASLVKPESGTAALTPAESVIQDLFRWKIEASMVLKEWDKVADAVEAIDPCPLGHSKAEHVLRYIERTR